MTAANAKQHSLKRIAPGYYETANGKWEIVRSAHDDNSVWWYFRSTVAGHDFDDVQCLYRTKWEAVETMDVAIQHCSDNGLDY